MTKVNLPDEKVTLEKCSENDNGEAVTHLQNMVLIYIVLEGKNKNIKRSLEKGSFLLIQALCHLYNFFCQLISCCFIFRLGINSYNRFCIGFT